VTVDKITMIQAKGIQYEDTIEELRKTFSMPEASSGPTNRPPPAANEMPSRDGSSIKQSRSFRSRSSGGSRGSRGRQADDAHTLRAVKSHKHSTQKNKVMRVLSSMRKKKP
jgi:hypothetical protein